MGNPASSGSQYTSRLLPSITPAPTNQTPSNPPPRSARAPPPLFLQRGPLFTDALLRGPPPFFSSESGSWSWSWSWSGGPTCARDLLAPASNLLSSARKSASFPQICRHLPTCVGKCQRRCSCVPTKAPLKKAPAANSRVAALLSRSRASSRPAPAADTTWHKNCKLCRRLPIRDWLPRHRPDALAR